MAKCSLGFEFHSTFGNKVHFEYFIEKYLFRFNFTRDKCYGKLLYLTNSKGKGVFFVNIFKISLPNKQNPMWVSFGIYFQNMLSLYSSLFFEQIWSWFFSFISKSHVHSQRPHNLSLIMVKLWSRKHFFTSQRTIVKKHSFFALISYWGLCEFLSLDWERIWFAEIWFLFQLKSSR